MDNWTDTQVWRATRNSLIWNGISLAILLLILWLLSDYYYYFFRGPVSLTDAQLLTVLERDSQRSLIEYVEFHDRELIPTNWQEISTQDGQPYSTAPYFLLPIDPGKFLLVLTDARSDGKRLKGPLGGAREMDRRVIQAVIEAHPEYQGRILPVVLAGNAAFEVFGYIFLVVIIPWGSYCLLNVARAVMARANPSSHHFLRPLSHFADSAELVASINREVESGSVQQFGKAILTDSWILRPTVFGAFIVRVDDVAWIYHLQRNTESFAVINLRSGKTVAMSLRPQQAEQLVRAIGEKTPWAFIGYTSELSKRWSRNRSELIEQIEQFRQKRN